MSKMRWVAEGMPKKCGNYLCTVFDDSTMENYVITCEWQRRPFFKPPRFYCTEKYMYGKDVTDYVIAWMEFPYAYDKTRNPILSDEEDAWVAQHL